MRCARFALFVFLFLGVLQPATGVAADSAPRVLAPRAAPADTLFPCQPDAMTLCLNQGRFEVTANFVTSNASGDVTGFHDYSIPNSAYHIIAS